MRVVHDTNVVMSRFLSPSGIPVNLVKHWLKEQPFTLVVTEEILHEYAGVLLYPHIQKRHQLLHSHIERFIIQPVEKVQVKTVRLLCLRCFSGILSAG